MSFRTFLTPEEIVKQNRMYSQYARDAKARGEYDVAKYYEKQVRPIPAQPPTAQEAQHNNEMYSQYARDAKARGEPDVEQYYHSQRR